MISMLQIGVHLLLMIGHFVNRYMDKSVDLIRETTKSDKVSLFGYCWGGDLVLMYAALHPEKVKNVIVVATPGDFSADDTLSSLWTKNMDVEALLDAFIDKCSFSAKKSNRKYP